jgi:alginate O-acetyltransferase complex protein AlgI
MFGYGSKGLFNETSLYYLYTNGLLFIILAICSTPYPKKAFEKIKEKLKFTGAILNPLVYLILIFIATAYLVNETYNPFLYFRF